MPRKAAPVLAEILAAIEGIELSTADKTIDDYGREWLLKHGVQRGIEIISEASRHLPAAMLQAHPEIPWKQISGIGSVLRHEYHSIADRIIWRVITEDLPPLKAAVLSLRDGLRQ